jgi:hypothetical protein
VTALPDDRDVLPLAEVRAEAVRWLWRGYVPLGKLTILDGDPGLGKSAVTLDLAARVTRGDVMPDGSRGDLDAPADVVLLCAEDGLADTIRPRLEAAGADLERIVSFLSVRTGIDRRLVALPTDCKRLARTVAERQARVVIVDPLMAYLDASVNAHRDQDVRRTLAPLVRIAEELGVAMLVVRHLTKMADASPLYRGGGSIGIIGAARSGLVVAADPDDPTNRRRVLATVKGNLAAPAPALAYHLEEETVGAEAAIATVRVVWEGPVPQTAATLLAVRPPGSGTALADALDLLRDVLAEGPVAALEVRAAAERAEISYATLRRAKDALGIVARKARTPDGGWLWALPAEAPPAPEDAEGAHPRASTP